MQHQNSLNEAEERILWDRAANRLELVYLPPAPTREEMQQLSDFLPLRRQEESLYAWQQRCKQETERLSKVLSPWRKGESLSVWLHRCKEKIDRLSDVLSPWQKGESLYAWLQRTRTGELIPFPAKLITLGQIVRLAADSAEQQFPLPDPNTPLESNDGSFRLTINPAPQNKIRIVLQVLGADAPEFGGQRLGIVSAGDTRILVADIRLDEYGDGEAYIENIPEIRQALLAPVIVLIQENGG